MQLPLFVQTPVINLTDSAIIRVPAGAWTIELDNKDSIVNLSIGPAIYEKVHNGQVIKIDTSSPARAMIVQAGSERHLTLYLNDNLPPDTSV